MIIIIKHDSLLIKIYTIIMIMYKVVIKWNYSRYENDENLITVKI